LGSETYTRRTELEERELCLRSQGELPPREWETDVVILTYRNVESVSAAQFANTPRVSGGQAFSANRTIEPVTVDGRDAVRLVWEPTKGGETAGFVIPANGRMYVLMPALSSLPSQLAKGWLDDIATSFRAVTPQPSPAPTPSAAPTPRCGA
jgi:predicted Zn-dependent protease